MSKFDLNGKVHMVDVSEKNETFRTARAHARVILNKETLEKIKLGEVKKGEVLTTAKIAGILAAKKTHELIPLCHPLDITYADISFQFTDEPAYIEIESFIKLVGKTGAEMEALTAVSVAALTIYDMCKSLDREIEIQEIYLLEKTGGKSGHFLRQK